MHSRSIYTTTDGNKDTSVHHITGASNSSKFYTPVSPSHDDRSNVPAFGVRRQTMLVQELYTVGYYIYTVDGDNVTVDFYSSDAVTTGSDITSTPEMTFTKKDTFGYSLHGQQFIVEQEAPYTVVRDGAARILGGINTYDARDAVAERKCSHEVTTGWAPRTAGLYTDIFTIWGMANAFGSGQTDAYCLSIAYDPYLISEDLAATGQVGIATRGADAWENAVSGNTGGTKRFVVGSYDPSAHTLGTYGVDTINRRFWVVVNYNADFAVAPSI
jgi:hypothetical protein